MHKVYKKRIISDEKRDLVTLLSEETKISKEKIKLALNSGAVWRKRAGKGKLLRVRRASSEVIIGDQIELYYDEEILKRKSLTAKLLFENKNWGVWVKPSGMLSEGNEYGDHLSLLRQVEKEKEEAFLIHRLDREVLGLMLVAYNSKTAGFFSKVWKSSDVSKIYRAEVLGDVKKTLGIEGKIEESLDGKEALTFFKVLESSEEKSFVEIEIRTGRYHQIRRHFAGLGHPVLGDPRYGKNNKNQEGIRLWSYRLSFVDKKEYSFTLPEEYL